MLKQLGKYKIQSVLGHGAMGEVYLAHHPTIGRDVAIKTIIPSLASGADAEDRFRREAKAAGTLNHPNIVTIYDFDRDGDLLYLVMEYVKGEDLEVIINEQSLSSSLLLEVLAQVCDGLGYAHRNGVVHRDIKPANVRVTRDGGRVLAKVMDFGIARIQDSNMTGTGIVMGTVSYMAPEYIQHGISTPQGDLWAVGVMLYQCLTGERPFGGDNTTTILFKIVSAEPPLLDPVTIQGISPSIQGILSCALSKDPARRFKTAEEFANSLRACQDPAWEGNLEGTAMLAAIPLDPDATSYLAKKAPRQPLPPAAVTTPQPTRSRAGLLTTVGAGLLALAGAGAYFFAGSRTSVPTAATEGPSAPAAQGVNVATPAPAGPAASAPVAGAKPTSPLPSAAASAPSAGAALPQPLPPGQAPPTATPPAPKPTAPIPSLETPSEKLAKAVAVLPSDPDLAAELLLSLAATQPSHAPIQGNLLAALYRIGNAGGFERALDTARANGLSGPQMMKAAPAFRQAMTEELRAHKAKDKSNVLTLATLNKIVN